MNKRPTLSICMIAKNERENFPRLLESLKGCADELCVCDTGSTDGTVEYLQDLAKTGKDKELYGAELKLGFFEWINDFSAARNASYELATQDYVMWIDLDDVLMEKESFINWRNDAMKYADYWLCAYDYAMDEKGNSVCKFLRERVIKRSLNPRWEFFVHEGCKPPAGAKKISYASSWYVKHLRTSEDMAKDKARNLKLFAERKDSLVPRMQFYYGKELFENNQHMEAYTNLIKAIETKSLELHDNILAHQYAGYAAMACGQYDKARDIALRGLEIIPHRAEIHMLIADSYIKQNRLLEALPFLGAAKECVNTNPTEGKTFSPIYNVPNFYTTYPRTILAKAKFHMGNFDGAKAEADECYELYKDPDSKRISDEIAAINKKIVWKEDREEVDDVVITSPPAGMYKWDWQIYKERGIGGSETAAVEMAEWIKKKTGRNVIIFNERDDEYVSPAGVKYLSNKKVPEYFAEKKPYRHIMWRHNTKLTDAKTYLWCHDLYTPTVESQQNFDYHLCLSNFHKKYVVAMQAVPEDKIIVTRNGLDPERFKEKLEKNPYKIIWPNSPDRGLDRAIIIMDKAREKIPELTLDVFYGMDNMKKMGGFAEKVAQLEKMIADRPWITYHGNVEQRKLAEHFKQSSVWLYPADFIETYCITAIEALSSQTYPLVREFGALEDTVRAAANQGQATMFDFDAKTDEEVEKWASELVDIVREKRWERINVNPEIHSWASVADEWIRFMEL